MQPQNYIESLGTKRGSREWASLPGSFSECAHQPQSHQNRSNYEYCVVRDPSKQSGKVQALDERRNIFSKEVSDSGNNIAKPLQ
ncbi:MAG: hypothetical protein ACREDD_14265 [Methylocella sp.]